VELRGDVSHLLVKEAVDQSVNVLVGRDGSCAVGELIADGIESLLEGLALLESKNAGPPKCDRPGTRQPDIEWPKPEVCIN
jgi:hypothetical protein